MGIITKELRTKFVVLAIKIVKFGNIFNFFGTKKKIVLFCNYARRFPISGS